LNRIFIPFYIEINIFFLLHCKITLRHSPKALPNHLKPLLTHPEPNAMGDNAIANEGSRHRPFYVSGATRMAQIPDRQKETGAADGLRR